MGPSLFCESRYDRTLRQAGFTAIEFVAAIALATFIGVVGYSAYRTYTVRAEVALGLEVGHAVAVDVTATLARTRELPSDGVITPPCDTDPTGARLIESVTLENGRIDIRFGDRANPAITGRQVSLTPYETASLEIVWICGNDTPGPGLNPLGFLAGGPQTQHRAATIPPRYLPRNCR